MPRRSVRARRALRRRELRHRPGVRAGRDAEPRRPLQPGLAAGAARTDRRGEGAGDDRRAARRGQRRPVQRRLESRRAGVHRPLGRRISRAPDGTSNRPWPGWTGCMRPSPGSSRACRISSRRSSDSGGSARRNGTSAVSRSRPQALDRVWATATALRCRALIAAAAGDLDAAQRAAEASVELLEGDVQPFETARSRAGPRPDPSAGEAKAPREGVARAARATHSPSSGARLWVDRAERGARPDRRAAVDAVRADRDRAERSRRSSPAATRTRRPPTRCSSARARSRRTSSASTRSSASGRGRSWRRRSISPPSPDRTRSRSSNVPVREVPAGSSVPSVIDEPRLRLADTEGSR